MTNRSRPPIRRVAALAALALAVGPLLGTGAASAAPGELAALPYGSPLPIHDEVRQSLDALSGTPSVFVEFSGTSALDVALSTSSDAPVDARVAEIDSTAAAVTDEVTSTDADTAVLYVSRYTVPGVALQADAQALQELADNPDVTSITPLVPRSLGEPLAADPSNAASDAFTQALQVWQQTGYTGHDVHIAVIDTGLDYTHADFGGPGTTAAYQSALASNAAPDASVADPAKYLGGHDFAGRTYNANPTVESTYDPVPAPDDNPIDGPGGGHGTHVAGTAAGYGVSGDGTTFDGDYAALDETSLGSFDIGPGAAPEAGLYSLKVFGDNGGSTNLTGAALDWVGQQIAQGTRIDVVNLSLGTDYGPVDDPDAVKVQALMDVGVLPVLAAGNAGDVTDIAGSPGSAARSLAVAASSSGNVVQDAFGVDAPAAAAGTYPGQYSQASSGPQVSGRVVAPAASGNTEGCSPFDATDAAAIAGNIVWLVWDDANIRCASSTRFGNATDAGAIGVLLTSTTDNFEAGISGDVFTPGIQMTASTTAALTPALQAGTLEVTLDVSRRGEISRDDPALADTIAGFTSRGLHGSYDDVVKPDVAAPGVSIVSAGNGTGTGSAIQSGTSMASPLVAGIAALVTQAHPDWSPDQVKAGVMNTSVHDVTTGGTDPLAYGPARVGTGRVDAAGAVANDVLVSSVENPGLVTGSFGVVEVGSAAVAQTRTFEVTNTGTQDRSFTVGYSPRTQMPGVAYTLSTTSISVPAGGRTSFTVTMSIPDPAALRRALDPTMAPQQGGMPRQFVSDASGVVALTPADVAQPPLRVSVFAAPKPVSDTVGADITFPAADTDTGDLAMGGRGVDQGSGTGRFASLVAPFQLGVQDPDDTFPAGSAAHLLDSLDIRAVGASSTAPQLTDPSQGVLSFGLDMDGDWTRLSPFGAPTVEFDVNGDQLIDFATTISFGNRQDIALSITYDVSTGAEVDRRQVNGFDGSVDTNQFDNDVLVLPVSLAALGYTADTTDTTVRYQVTTQSPYATGARDEPADYLVDRTSEATFDVFAPAVWFGSSGQSGAGSALFADGAGTIPVHRTAGTTTAGDGVQALLLHLHGAEGTRAQILDLADATGSGPAPGPGPEPAPSPAPPTPTHPAGPGTPRPGDPSAPDAGAPGGRDDLATTGSALLPWLVAGAILVGVGGSTTWLGRRRRTQAESQTAQVDLG